MTKALGDSATWVSQFAPRANVFEAMTAVMLCIGVWMVPTEGETRRSEPVGTPLHDGVGLDRNLLVDQNE